MKIIYFGSSVPDAVRQAPNQLRKLIGSEACHRRESHIFRSLQDFNIESSKLVFVSTAYGEKSGPFRNQTILDGDTKIVCLGYWGSKYFRHLTSYVTAFCWIAKNYNANDVAITYNFPPVYALPILIMRFFGKRKLVIEFEDFFNPSDIRYYIYGPFVYLGIKMSSAFLASSEGMKTYLSRLRPESNIVVNGGYCPETIMSSDSPLESDGPVKILYSGSLDAERGVENLLGYFRSQSDLNFNLSFSGSGPLSNAIMLAAEKDDRVKYLGLLDQVDYAQAIQSADICINSQYSSISVNFPSKITTYLAFGKIVLSTEIESLVNSAYSDSLIFYNDQDPTDFWAKLYFIKENIDKLNSQSEARKSALKDILIGQEKAFGRLIKQMVIPESI
jgi:glycosyltransferase involved in cell wall biosynthesis